jgi:NAD(P)H-dependent FMN reductase
MVAVGIIVGSTRPGRVGSGIANWLAEQAATLGYDEIDLIELADVALPFLDEPNDATTGIYTKQHTLDWSARISAIDAFIIVTPEYNRSFPAPLKNALDYLSAEWADKPVAMVGYGRMSSGTRAVAALLPVITSLGMFCVGDIYVPLNRRVGTANGGLAMTEQDVESAGELIRKLHRMAGALSPAGAA